MKPVKLEFEGINSFSEHTIIDFEKLTKSGIFGIFGDTGSGKSTILDCINFALYGRVERSKEKTDIINYRSGSAFVKFTFDIDTDGKRKTYYVERLIKKDNSGTHRAFLYENGVCIADKATEVEKKIVEAIGLEAEDFRKCIALPQGEFSQFVKSAPRDRLALIERLFSLSKYGDRLKEKISVEQSEADGEYRNLCGKYSAYDDVTSENAEIISKRLQESRSRLKDMTLRAKQAAEKYAEVTGLFKKKEELEAVNAKIAGLEKTDAEAKDLREGLALLPVCREVNAVNCEFSDIAKRLSDTEDSLRGQQAKLKEAETELKELENALEKGNYAEKSDEYIKLSAKYRTLAGKPQKLEETERALTEKRDEYSAAEEELRNSVSAYDETRENAEKIKELLGENNSDELEKLINVEFKGAVLRSEYVAALDYFVGLNAEVERYYDNSELYKFIRKELKEQIEIFKQRIAAVKDFKLKNVTKQLDVMREKLKEREENSQKLLIYTREASEARGRIDVGKAKLETLKKEGAELRKRFDELKEELSRVFGEDCRDYAAAERLNSERKEQIKAEWQDLKLKILRASENRLQAELKCENLKTLYNSLKERSAELSSKLETLIAKSGLGNAKNCVDLVKKLEAVPDFEKTLNELDLQLAALRARKAELSVTDGILKIGAADVSAAERLKEEAEEELAKLNGDVAVTLSGLNAMNVRLKEKEELFKQLEKAKNRLDLVGRLKELTKSNRFLEYIADEYLCDISSLASSTLLKLTDGRYSLVYKDNNFNVGDNFDCGNLRGVNTLSGGETFLLSLSLALALSRTICSNSLKSIEFFFLDEGFGTLDSSLIDTVMNALEKLKSERFTIGVISHVEELKHRIDSKITVFKATESHGSIVQMSC